MSKEITHFKMMPEDIQWSAEANVVSVIYESFVTPADEDYLMARLLAQKGLMRGFYWAAAQATEKYLKALVLMSGQSVKEFKGHPIRKLFEVACTIDKSLIDADIMPHPNIKIESSVLKFLENFTVQSFIAELENHGNSDNRYNAFGVKYNTGHLFAMDSLSFHVRKKIGVVSIDRSFNKISPDLVELFKKHNPWFGSQKMSNVNQIPNRDFPIIDSCSVTKLEFLIKHKDNPAYSMALQWLNAKMKIPKFK